MKSSIVLSMLLVALAVLSVEPRKPCTQECYTTARVCQDNCGGGDGCSNKCGLVLDKCCKKKKRGEILFPKEMMDAF